MSLRQTYLCICAALALATSACLAPPPNWSAQVERSVVRGDSVEEAKHVAEILSELEPRLLAMLPDAELDELEVWIQDRPSLYKSPQPAVADAEGLWSEAHDRILISRHADSVERTLAHELVHAALGTSWHTLPGSLEEGLCDAISARLVPEGAARLRAGRLSSAALACGGLALDLEVEDIRRGRGSWTARIGLTTDELPTEGHMSVFNVQAGLSSSTLASTTKRGYYGLSFLIVERIIERHGLAGLNELCVRADERGHRKVPTAWLLEAAGLDSDPSSWRQAALESLGEGEVAELLEMYPHFIVDALVEFLAKSGAIGLHGLNASVELVSTQTRVDVGALDFIRDQVELSLASNQ